MSSGALAAEPSGSGVSRRLDRLLVIGAASVAIGLCWPALQGLSFLWSGSRFYGHAWALPVAAAWVAWTRRAALGRALREPHPPAAGSLLVFAVAAAYVLAVVGDVGFAAGLGIPLLLGATAWALGGMPLLRPLLLPLAFLALMVPPPRFVQFELLFRLKLFVTEVAISLLHAFGVTVVAEGNQVLLPEHTLFVADACSGLTSIVTLLPLSCVVATFLSRGVWRRVLVVLSVFPLAIGANVLRVVATVLLVSYLGEEAAQGLLHESFGLATFTLGTLAVIGVARVLR
jgi:exosortase